MNKKLLNIITSLFVVFGMLTAAPAALADGDHGKGKSELNGTISAVDATTVTVTPKKGGADVVLNVDATTFIKRNGAPALITNLLVGDKVEAKYDKTTMLASKIEAKSMPTSREIEGYIAAVGANTLTITPKKGGADVTVNVDATTVITRSGKPALLTELLVGDKVEAKYDKTTLLASKIKAKAKPVKAEVEGMIAAVGADSLTITPRKGGADVTVLVDATTRITRGGKTALLTDLLVGEKVEAKYNTTTMIASKIEDKARDQSNFVELHGAISAIDLSLGTVTITPRKGGAVVVLTVDATTRIQRGHTTIALADLMVGDKVEAKYDKTTFLARMIEIDD